jgi:site-specific DNA-cytosine methylase
LGSAEVQSISIDVKYYNQAKDWKPANGVIGTLRASQKPRIANAGIEVNYGNKAEIRDFGKVGPSLKASVPPRITGSIANGESVRHLTIEESKTLQGFPEWFEIYENEYKFLGNSVCPPMAEAIGRHLVALLGEA